MFNFILSRIKTNLSFHTPDYKLTIATRRCFGDS